jgi:hypothetical protein
MQNYQENYHTDMKHTNIKGRKFEGEEDDHFELRRYIPPSPRDVADLSNHQAEMDLFRDSLSNNEAFHLLTPAPQQMTPFIRDEAEDRYLAALER